MLIPMLHDFKQEQHGAILKKISEAVDARGLKPLLDEMQFSLSELGQAIGNRTNVQNEKENSTYRRH